jgi:phosphomannomutase
MRYPTTQIIDRILSIKLCASDFYKSWVQIRKSNTEPIIRIIAEAETKSEAQSLIDKILSII